MPETNLSDINFINKLCASPDFPFSGAEKAAACKQLLPRIISQKDKIIAVIENFLLVPATKKKEIIARVNMFFEALNQISDSPGAR